MLDTLRQVETPEGLALELRCAGLVPRALAWTVDAGLRMMAFIFGMTILGGLGAAGMGMALLLAFVVYWGYPIGFEVLRNGQTPGKSLLGLRVVNDNGTPVGWIPAVVRNLLRTLDMLPFLYGFGAVASLVDPSARRLGDLVAGTVVVYAEPPTRVASAPQATAVPPPPGLRVEEQAAVVAFAERSSRLTPERQEELAELLQPITRLRGTAAVQRVWGWANYVLGGS